VPFYLGLYFELQRWPGTLLVEGGLLDQPSWTWEMIDLAGRMYMGVHATNQETMELLRQGQVTDGQN
jgi:hypothetical protein